MSWHDLIDFEDTYEICDEYPYTIRKKSTGREIKETLNNDGYYSICLNLNGKQKHFQKHRIIAKQFIPNPDNLSLIDHKNRDKTDNHIINLRWLSKSGNSKNKSSSHGVEYEFIDYDAAPRDLIIITDYGKHELVDYYYSPSNDLFYYDNDSQLRILHYNIDKDGYQYIIVYNTKNKRIQIRHNKFKKLYHL